jgi:hypothetical protein
VLRCAGKKGGKHKAVEESEDEDAAAAADTQEPEFDPAPYQRSVAMSRALSERNPAMQLLALTRAGAHVWYSSSAAN